VPRSKVGVLPRVARTAERVRRALDSRTTRAMCPALLFVGILPLLVLPIGRELGSVLFRDAAMCQYSGWCIRHGVRLYDQVAAADGPFIHFLHAIFQVFAGITDRGCRKADLVFQIALSASMGAVLAPAFAAGRGAQIAQRVAWASLGVAMWLSYYLSLGADQTVQRDPYYALAGYLGMMLVFASADWSPAGGRALAFAGGLLATLMIFSRPFGAIYPAMCALAFFLEDRRDADSAASLPRRVRAAAAGAGVAVVGVLVAVAIVGSLSGLFFWYLRYPLVVYRFIGRQPPLALLTDSYGAAAEVAITMFVGLFAAMAAGVLPWRAIGFAIAPALFLFSACWTGKGWSNHVVQVNAARPLVLLLALSRLWGHGANRPWSKLHAVVAFVVLAYAAQQSVQYLASSEFSKSAFRSVPEKGPFEVAEFLKTHTRPDDRVFLFGHEPHALLMAERAPAVPYYVDLTFDIPTLLRKQPPAAGLEPTPAEQASIERIERQIATDACGRLSAHFPAAMVFEDDSLGTWGIPDGVSDVATICPDVRAWLRDNYTLATTIATYHVYLRKASSS
jgi:hypothetical protein